MWFIAAVQHCSLYRPDACRWQNMGSSHKDIAYFIEWLIPNSSFLLMKKCRHLQHTHRNKTWGVLAKEYKSLLQARRWQE